MFLKLSLWLIRTKRRHLERSLSIWDLPRSLELDGLILVEEALNDILKMKGAKS